MLLSFLRDARTYSSGTVDVTFTSATRPNVIAADGVNLGGGGGGPLVVGVERGSAFNHRPLASRRCAGNLLEIAV